MTFDGFLRLAGCHPHVTLSRGLDLDEPREAASGQFEPNLFVVFCLAGPNLEVRPDASTVDIEALDLQAFPNQPFDKRTQSLVLT